MPVDFIFASITDGTIDSTYKYAWGENIGWVNFGPPPGNVHITDSGLSGYALSETIGWINLDNVTNDGQGNLSGFAWGENIGWVNFAPTNGGVIINSSGEFTGSALEENIGWIIFNCNTSACVKTDWRPQSARPACNNAIDNDADGKIDYPNDPGCSSLTDNDETDPAPPSGGSGLPSVAYNPPAPPAEGFSILINNDVEITDSRTVTLNLQAGSDTKRMAISNFSDFRQVGQETYASTKTWTLTEGQGEKTVYVKFYTQYGRPSEIVSDTIVLERPEIEEPLLKETKIVQIQKRILEIIQQLVFLYARLILMLTGQNWDFFNPPPWSGVFHFWKIQVE